VAANQAGFRYACQKPDTKLELVRVHQKVFWAFGVEYLNVEAIHFFPVGHGTGQFNHLLLALHGVDLTT